MRVGSGRVQKRVTRGQLWADLRPSADGSAVRASLMAGRGQAAGSQRACSLGSCATGQTYVRTDRQTDGSLCPLTTGSINGSIN